MRHQVKINRAPVLTLWAAVVAQRLGFERDEALTLGRAVAGLNAHSKGVSIGLFKPSPQAVRAERREPVTPKIFEIELLHRAVPSVRTKQGLRALSKGRPIEPATVERYLNGKFGDALDDVNAAMTKLAMAHPVKDINRNGYAIYEQFRPRIPAGKKGWGATGILSLDKILSMSERD